MKSSVGGGGYLGEFPGQDYYDENNTYHDGNKSPIDYGDPKKGLGFGFRASLRVVSYALNVVVNDIAYAVTMAVLSPPAAASSFFDGLWSYNGYLDYESDAKNLSQEIIDIRDDVFDDGNRDCSEN
jgi:hypothetical protein